MRTVLLCAALSLSLSATAGEADEAAESWVDRHAGAPGADDVAYAAAASPDEPIVYVVGDTRDVASPHARGLVIAYDARTGARVWTAASSLGGLDGFRTLTVTPDGELVVAVGDVQREGAAGVDALAVAFDARTGAARWTAVYEGIDGRDANGFSHVVSSADSSTIFAAGMGDIDEAGLHEGYETVALEAATGDMVWARRYDGAGSIDLMYGLASAGDRVFVTGSTWHGFHRHGGSGFDVTTVAYRSVDGEHLWTARHSESEEFDLALEIHADLDRAYVLANGPAHGKQVFALDAETGTQAWKRQTDGRRSALDGVLRGDTLYVGGWSDANGTDMTLDAYDVETGARRWASSYNGIRHGVDYTRAIALSPDGKRLYAAGTSETPTGHDYAVIAVDAAAGTTEWVERYSAEIIGLDVPSSTVVTGDGSRIVTTGDTQSLDGSWDWLTVGLPARPCEEDRERNVVTGAIDEIEPWLGPGRAPVRAAACRIFARPNDP